MRFLLALGGALALAGCVSGERVTLLAPVQEAKIAAGEVGAIAVLDADGNDARILRLENEQAQLRSGGSRIRQLDTATARHQQIIGDLPMPVVRRSFKFQSGESTLVREQLQQLQGFLSENITGRAGLQIEINAQADATGNEADNNALTERRAGLVLGQVLDRITAANLEIPAENIDVVAGGWYTHLRVLEERRRKYTDDDGNLIAPHKAEDFEVPVADEEFRVVEVIIR